MSRLLESVMVLARLHLELYHVKSLTVDSVDIGLGDECVLVDRLDYAEYGDRFNLATHDDEHLNLMLGVPAHSREHGAASTGLIIDCSGYFLPITRYDGELYSLTVGVYKPLLEVTVFCLQFSKFATAHYYHSVISS